MTPRTTIVVDLLPISIALVTLLFDLLSTLKIPKEIQRCFDIVLKPFQQFLTLDDLVDSDPQVIDPPLWQQSALFLLSVVESAAWLGATTFEAVSGDRTRVFSTLGVFLSWSYASARLYIKPPCTPPYQFIVFAILNAISSITHFTYNYLDASLSTSSIAVHSLEILWSILITWVSGTLPMKAVKPVSNVAQPKDVPSVTLSCPEDNVTLWQWCTFSFIEPIFSLATSRTLNEGDVWMLSPFFRHKNLFTKCLAYRSRYPTQSLLKFLIISNSFDLILDVSLELWSTVVGFVCPYALKEILAALDGPKPDYRSAYFWAGVTFVAHLSFAQKDLIKCWHVRRTYERTRGQLFCTLHYKTLKRQDIAGKSTHGDDRKENADLGKILNLMQGDVYAVSQRFWEFSGICTAPVKLVIALVFLYRVLGWSALSGVVVVSFAYVLNYPLAKYNIHITRLSWQSRDKRMNVVNELLQNIRFLKFYGWETAWRNKVQSARNVELDWRIKQNIVATLISFIWTWMPSATVLTSFLCYTLIAGERLTVSKAFTSLALFSHLQDPMTQLPGQFFAMLNAYVSMQRIEEFLSEDEVPDWASTLSAPIVTTIKKVGFEDASFEWHGRVEAPGRPNHFVLGPLNINFPLGKLILVTGATGSGKSALLAALLGEMHCSSGQVFLDKRNHRVALCAQVPWLEHATIRDNIIFGSSRGYDKIRYQKVIQACALIPDLQRLDAGDLTEIGEKGITMSGGQRARIALARAMYSEAQFILLDDPIAAVDMHTAQHLVANCLSRDLAEGRTIILVTHHISLCLPIAHYVVTLTQGKVTQQGTVEELRRLSLLQEVVESQDEEFLSEEPGACTSTNEADTAGKSILNPQIEERQKHSGKLIEAEARAEGRVSIHTYLTYIRAAGIFSWLLTLLLMLLIRGINILNQVFLAKWGEAYSAHSLYFLLSARVRVSQYIWDTLPSPDVNVKPWLLIFLYISTVGAFSVLFYIAIGYYASLQASRSLFDSLLTRLSRAPTRFYDVTPIGRILNRFSTDMNTIDNALQNSARSALSGGMDFVASFSVILVVIPAFSPFALFVAWLYIRLAPPYIRASRDLRRLESISLSPAFNGYDELLRGLVHVRAFGMEARYQENFYKKVDKFQSFDHVYWLVSAWLRWRYDCLGSVVIFFSTIFALWKGVSNGSAAIVIVQAGIFAEASRQLVKVCAQLELDFNSVERVVEYLDTQQEAPAIIEDKRPPAYWPSSSGELVIEDLSIRYAPDLPAVLRGISLVVKPGEKIGVVGRTGSGKSTLALSLLRIIEPCGGRIIIDGIDVSTIGLDDLRKRITIISQDVSLFTGTLRSNIDPFDEHTDQECWDVLERCHLTSTLSRGRKRESVTLDMPISQSGSLSAGERQLVALARAILRRTNVIVMDEATSQIDSNLDDQIQKTIREELSGALVITIAHRLKTIIDYDRVVVLDAGEIVEVGKPDELLNKSRGAFREMCRKSADWHLLAGESK